MSKLLINKVSVEIPKNKTKEIELAKLVIAQEATLGATSAIATLDWASKAPDVASAELHDKKAEEYDRLAEEEREARNVLLEPIDDLLKQSRDILKGVYRKTPHKLGEWGFNVKQGSSEISTKVQ